MVYPYLIKSQIGNVKIKIKLKGAVNLHLVIADYLIAFAHLSCL